MSEAQSIPVEEKTFCEVHPDRETSLRCNKCGRYMCPDCAVSTPVGYRCKQCVRQHENKFYSASQPDYAIIFVVCAVLSGVGGFIASAVGYIFLLLIAGVPVGGFIAEAALRAVKRRRGRYSGQIGALAAVIGGLLGGIAHTYSLIAPAFQQAGELGAEQMPIGLTIDFLLRMTLMNPGLLIFIGIVAFFIYNRFKMKA